MNKIFVLLSFILFAIGCTKEGTHADYKPKIVVDGWIENNGYAYVFLTKTTQFESIVDTASYYKMVLTHAKVIVKTDNTREVLTLMYDNSFFPPHFYRSVDLKGKTGKSYQLEVIVNGDTLHAQTTIPDPPKIDTLYYEPDPSEKDLGFIWIGFSDPANQANYYRSFSRIVGQEQRFNPTYLSVLNDTRINGRHTELPLYRGLVTNTNRKQEYHYQKGDYVLIKFTNISKECYDYWLGYENELINSNNPFGNGGSNLSTNIEGGMGIWCGYGATYANIICK